MTKPISTPFIAGFPAPLVRIVAERLKLSDGEAVRRIRAMLYVGVEDNGKGESFDPDERDKHGGWR